MKYTLSKNPIHLGLGATATSEPEFTGMDWYEAYGARHDDGSEGRLVSMYTFAGSWDMWEMHPKGAEVVVCINGRMTLIQALEDGEQRVTLEAGEYLINPPGVWHTADVARGESVTAMFITAGLGTEHRRRQ